MIMFNRSKNSKFDFAQIRNWDVIVDNMALVLLKTRIREYVNINVIPKVKDSHKAEIKYSCLKQNGELDEYILSLDLLGCKDNGYNSMISQTWRDCLEANFGEEYHDYVAKKLSNVKNEHSC